MLIEERRETNPSSETISLLIVIFLTEPSHNSSSVHVSFLSTGGGFLLAAVVWENIIGLRLLIFLERLGSAVLSIVVSDVLPRLVEPSVESVDVLPLLDEPSDTWDDVLLPLLDEPSDISDDVVLMPLLTEPSVDSDDVVLTPLLIEPSDDCSYNNNGPLFLLVLL